MWLPAPTLGNAQWRKSSRTQGAQNCVELADLGQTTAVRDSKAPAGPALVFAESPWAAFLTSVKRGQLDLESPAQ